MALKPTRISPRGGDSVAYFMAETASRGGVVIWNASSDGSGNLDDPDAVVQTSTSNTGTPVGVLMNDVVNLDLTRTHLNQHKDEVQINGKVTVLKYGTVQTDQLVSGNTPSAGDDAHYTAGGLFTTTGGSAVVGKFASSVDSDGYVVVDVRL